MVHSGALHFFLIIPFYVCLKCFLTSVISVHSIIVGEMFSLTIKEVVNLERKAVLVFILERGLRIEV